MLGKPGSAVRVDAGELERWLRADDLEELRLAILQADDRSDEEELARLRAEYRQHAMLERPASITGR
jgi:hypothetical protein